MADNATALAELRRLLGTLDAAASGRLAEELRREFAREVEAMTRNAWSKRQAPGGAPWQGKYGRLTMAQSGRLLSSLRVVAREGGVAASVEGEKFGRHSLASVHQYGGIVRSKVFATNSRGRRVNISRSKLLEGESLSKERVRGLGGAKPMRFRVNGRWVSAYSVRIPKTPLLPESGRLPEEWAAALEVAAQRVLERVQGAPG